MKIAKSELTKIIRESLLFEGAKKPEDFPGGLSIAVLPGVGRQKIAKYVWEGPGTAPAAGEIVWRESFKGPNEIIASKATKGWGPLLYDVAMELAGAKGVIPDRERVSPSAAAIWSFYSFSRPDVESAHVSSPGRPFGSPLAKMYRASGTPTISKLESLGKIKFEEPPEEEDF